MTEYQRECAMDLLYAVTDVPLHEIEEMDDHELEQWLYELGYDWDDTELMGEWVLTFVRS